MSESVRKLSINRWDEADRPRERLAKHGASALSDAELLAILIGSGTADESAVDLTRRILQDCKGSLSTLGKLPLDRLCQYKGIGQAKAITIMAACELGRRRAAEPPSDRVSLTDSGAVFRYFSAQMQDLPTEEMHVLLLNSRMQSLGSRCVSSGGLTQTLADVRCILREAIVARASAIVICHNHPSGSPLPSKQDDALTERVRQAADLMQIRLADHLIVADRNYYSYADEGRL